MEWTLEADEVSLCFLLVSYVVSKRMWVADTYFTIGMHAVRQCLFNLLQIYYLPVKLLWSGENPSTLDIFLTIPPQWF